MNSRVQKRGAIKVIRILSVRRSMCYSRTLHNWISGIRGLSSLKFEEI